MFDYRININRIFLTNRYYFIAIGKWGEMKEQREKIYKSGKEK